MSLTQGDPLPNVNTRTDQTTTAPGYYTGYLSDLAKAGQTAVAADPTKLVAGFSDLQQQGQAAVPGAATAYKPGLVAAGQTANTAAGGLTPENIQALMNPYTSNVVDEMGRLQQQNIQRNVMPGLKAAFAGTGSSGSQRFANATGQTMADMQSNLTGQQYGALNTGYNNAVNADLQNLQLQNNAAKTQADIAGQEQNLGLTGATSMMNTGAQQQALEQAKIDAPLKQATNVAQLLRGYTVPTATSQQYTGPMPGAYSASPLSQLAGLASLFASSGGGTSAVNGLTNWYKQTFPSSAGGSGSTTATHNNTIDANGNPVNPSGGNTVVNDPLGGGTDADYSGINTGPDLSGIDMGGGGETTYYGDDPYYPGGDGYTGP
jgi:hypothetical protein